MPPAIFTDFSGLDALRASARHTDSGEQGASSALDSDDALEGAARQFSSIFLHMALKSMREASFGGGILDSQQSEFYRDMFDQQIVLDLSEGEGFGLTQVIVDQLSNRLRSSTDESMPLKAAQAYEKVAGSTSAQETSIGADSDSETINLVSERMEKARSAVDKGTNVTSRLALP